MKGPTEASQRIALAFIAVCGLAAVTTADGAYRDVILSDNPVAYYRLEELPGAADAVDSGPNAFNGVYVFNNDATSPVLGLPGIDTNSVSFLGGASVGFVRIPYHAELSPSTDGTNGAPFSAECWAQPNAHPAVGTFRVPLAMFGPFGSGIYANASGWNFYQHAPSANRSHWILNMRPPVFLQVPAVSINPLEWYHLAVTYDGTNATFYINGVARGTSAAPGYLADNGANGQIGVGQNTGQAPFAGNVDEVAFYTNVLTAERILAHYTSGTNSFREIPTPPTISEEPVSTTAFAGTIATFSVNALGTLPLSFQWRRGSAPIPGATSRSLSFGCRFPDDNGATFSAVVSNAVGSVTSAVVTLTVSTELNVLSGPGSITRYVGSKAAFLVVANGALPITYQWYQDDIFNPIDGATNDTLWLAGVQPAADGSSYFAEVRNPFTNTTSSSASLTVVPRPTNIPITGHARFVVLDDPVAYWRLNEPDASLMAIDAVGSFDGTYNAMAGTLNYGVMPGIPRETDGAIGLAAGAVVLVPYALELNPPSGPWSVEAWVKPASLDPNHFRTVFSSMFNSDFGNHVFGWNVYQHVAGVWTLNIFSGGGASTFVSDFVHNPLVPNTWYHLAITDDRETMRFYVNGILVGSASQASSGFMANTAGPTVLGQRSDNAFDPFDGAIDEVAFFDKALSPQQVLAHYLSTVRLMIVRSSNNVVLSWPLGTLQSAPVVTGIYTNVPAAVSPFTNAVSGSQAYYRVQVQ